MDGGLEGFAGKKGVSDPFFPGNPADGNQCKGPDWRCGHPGKRNEAGSRADGQYSVCKSDGFIGGSGVLRLDNPVFGR